MTRQFGFYAAMISLGVSHAVNPAFAETELRVSSWPELNPDALLPLILAELKRTLVDPYSIRDFVLCPAAKIKMKNGKPERWTVQFSFNAKNAYGGYAGVRMYAAVFREGRISGAIASTQFGNSEGLEGLINNMIARKMATCPVVSDAKIQGLLSPAGSIYRQQ